MMIDLPGDVRSIIGKLENAGYEAYAVGGCVRDTILGRKPQDWDITTSALPQDIKRIFSRTVDTGIEHGTVTILIGSHAYETTTYRLDGKYSDSRHPDFVRFSTSLEEDLMRRDFTINAMAFSDGTGLMDMYGGISDINDRIIRCVGNPEERFNEDALRILRAVRFSAQLGFEIEEETRRAASKLAGKLSLISAERIRVELDKLLLSDHPDRLNVLHELGIDGIILPELADRPDVLPELIRELEKAPDSRYVRWALLLSRLSGGSLSENSGTDILHRLKFDNDTIHTVRKLLEFEETPLKNISDHEMRVVMNRAGIRIMKLLFAFRTVKDGDQSEAEARFERILEKGDCVSLSGLAVNGNDLIGAGFPKGKQIGTVLGALLEKVLEEPGLNTHDQLMELAKQL